MRWARFAFLGWLLVGSAAADSLRARMPAWLAARVVPGPRGDGIFVLEAAGQGNVALLVEQPLPPMGNASPPGAAELAEALAVPANFTLPTLLRPLELASPQEKLEAVVAWVGSRIVLEEEDGAPQDASSVLRRRRGRCSGRANAAVALLRRMGVPARAVHGMVVAPGGTRWHRWGEAWLPGWGWRPFDPGVAAGVVSVRYVATKGAEEGLELSGVQVEAVDESGFAALPLRGNLRVLPRRLGELKVRLPRPATVCLLGPGRDLQCREGLEARFLRLLPGSYWLWGGGLGERSFSLAAGQRLCLVWNEESPP